MRRVIGIVVFILGTILFVISTGFHELLVSPILLIMASIICWRYYYRRLALLFLLLGLLALADVNIWKLIISLFLLYFGYRLLVNQPKRELDDVPSTKDNSDINWGQSTIDNPFIGELRLGDQQYELKHIHVSHGISSVHVDLSRAIIPEGETTIIINGLIGQVHLYLPYDLDASIIASVIVGECEVLGRKQGGLKNQLSATTKGYEEAARKVKISVSLFIAQVHVRYL